MPNTTSSVSDSASTARLHKGLADTGPDVMQTFENASSIVLNGMTLNRSAGLNMEELPHPRSLYALGLTIPSLVVCAALMKNKRGSQMFTYTRIRTKCNPALVKFQYEL